MMMAMMIVMAKMTNRMFDDNDNDYSDDDDHNDDDHDDDIRSCRNSCLEWSQLIGCAHMMILTRRMIMTMMMILMMMMMRMMMRMMRIICEKLNCPAQVVTTNWHCPISV